MNYLIPFLKARFMLFNKCSYNYFLLTCTQVQPETEGSRIWSSIWGVHWQKIGSQVSKIRLHSESTVTDCSSSLPKTTKTLHTRPTKNNFKAIHLCDTLCATSLSHVLSFVHKVDYKWTDLVSFLQTIDFFNMFLVFLCNAHRAQSRTEFSKLMQQLERKQKKELTALW